MMYYVLVGPITKLPGDAFGARLTFEYLGPQMTVWVGIGLSYGKPAGHDPPFCYAMMQISIGPHTVWTPYTVDVSGVVPADAVLGKLLDAQRFISDSMPVVGQQPPNPFGVNDWDDEVYATVAAANYRNFNVAQYW